jgi:hypothetical protein
VNDDTARCSCVLNSLREEIADAIAARSDGWDVDMADAVLALPAVQQLLADAAAIRRVRGPCIRRLRAVRVARTGPAPAGEDPMNQPQQERTR